MAYMIFRVEKLKTKGNIAASGSHMMRTRPTRNADLSISNTILTGTDDPAHDVDVLLGQVPKIRSNAVLALEVLATASPEWWQAASNETKREWVNATRKELAATFGAENIAHLQLHIDESTPHLTGFIVPIHNGKLSARHWLNGREKMQGLQDRMAAAVAHLGLERGIKGSKAKHDRVKRFYSLINKSPTPIEPIGVLDVITKSDKLKAHNERLAAVVQMSAHADITARKNKGLEATNKSLSKKAEVLAEQRAAAEEKAERKKAQLKAQLDQLRLTSLEDVAVALGLTKEKDGNWKDDARTVAIGITGTKFMDRKADKGGGGAFDLVMHCMQCDFQTAKGWMISTFGTDALIAETVAPAMQQARKDARALQHGVKNGSVKTFKAPEEVPTNWHAVRHYLTQIRKLSGRVLDALNERHALYADRMQNVVFRSVHGAILRGTLPGSDFKGHAAGSDRGKAWRGIVGRTENSKANLVLAENPIDALSYMQLHDIEGTAASTGGVTDTMPENLRDAQWSMVTVAYDNDKQGRTMGAKLAADIKARGFEVREEYPSKAKDWNKVLQQAASKTPLERRNDDKGPSGPKM